MRAGFFALLLGGLAACQPAAPEPPTLPADSLGFNPAPAAALPATPDLYAVSLATPAGDTLRLASLRGRVVLVNFWATWCRPCLAEMPDLQRLRDQVGPERFEVVGISMDVAVEGEDQVTPYVERMGVTYPIGLGDQSVQDAFGGMLGLPTSLLFDAEGTFIRRFTGAVPVAQLEPFIADLAPPS